MDASLALAVLLIEAGADVNMKDKVSLSSACADAGMDR